MCAGVDQGWGDPDLPCSISCPDGAGQAVGPAAAGVGARVSALHRNNLASWVQFPRIKFGITPRATPGRKHRLPLCHTVRLFDLSCWAELVTSTKTPMMVIYFYFPPPTILCCRKSRAAFPQSFSTFYSTRPNVLPQAWTHSRARGQDTTPRTHLCPCASL